MVKSGESIYQDKDVKYHVSLYRGRWDQVRYTPPEHGVGPVDTCSDSPLARLVAEMFGFEELAQKCESSN
jgi:hypothetical protein